MRINNIQPYTQTSFKSLTDGRFENYKKNLSRMFSPSASDEIIEDFKYSSFDEIGNNEIQIFSMQNVVEAKKSLYETLKSANGYSQIAGAFKDFFAIQAKIASRAVCAIQSEQYFTLSEDIGSSFLLVGTDNVPDVYLPAFLSKIHTIEEVLLKDAKSNVERYMFMKGANELAILISERYDDKELAFAGGYRELYKHKGILLDSSFAGIGNNSKSQIKEVVELYRIAVNKEMQRNLREIYTLANPRNLMH